MENWTESILKFKCLFHIITTVEAPVLKRQPKMSSQGGRLWEVAAYKSFRYQNGHNFSLLQYGNLRDLPQCPCNVLSCHVKANFEKKIRFFPLRSFGFLH